MHLPLELIDIIAEIILNDAESLFESDCADADWDYVTEWNDSAEFSTLFSMTLVHRSWTNIARRRLWTRAYLDEERLIELPSKQRCSFLRELAVSVRESEGVDGTCDQLIESFATLLDRVPGIRDLHIWFNLCSDCDRHAFFWERFRKLENLEALWIEGIMWGVRPDHIYRLLSGPGGLLQLIFDCKFDRFEGFDDIDENSAFSDTLNKLGSRPSKLKSVILPSPCNEDPDYRPYTQWLLRPTAGYSIQHLTLCLEERGQYENFDGDHGLPAFLTECIARLECLHILAFARSAEDAVYIQGETINKFLAAASSSLRRFNLMCDDALQTARLDLPESLEEVAIQISASNQDNGGPLPIGQLHSNLTKTDENMQVVVSDWCARQSASSHGTKGKKVKIVLYATRMCTEYPLARAFPLTLHECERAGISMQFEETDFHTLLFTILLR